MKHRVNLCVVPWAENDFHLIQWCFGKVLGSVHNLLQYNNKQMLSKVYAVLCSYWEFWDTLMSFFIYVQIELWILKTIIKWILVIILWRHFSNIIHAYLNIIIFCWETVAHSFGFVCLHCSWHCNWFITSVFVPELFLSHDDMEKLHDFEEECAEDYFREKEMHMQSSSEKRIQLTNER